MLAVWMGALRRYLRVLYQPPLLFLRGRPNLDQDPLLCTTLVELLPIWLFSPQESFKLVSLRMSQCLVLRRFDVRVVARFQVLPANQAPQIAGECLS